MRDIEIGKLNGKYVVYWYEEDSSGKKRRRFRLKASNKNEARAEAIRVYDAEMVRKGSAIKFRDLWHRYQKFLGERRTAAQMTRVWNQIGDFFGELSPEQITDEVVKQYLIERRADFRRRRGRDISRGTLFAEINLVQSTLNFAWKKKLISTEPYKLAKPARPRRRERWLRGHEVTRLLEECRQTPHLFIAVVLLLGTGARSNEVLELKWKSVDFNERTIDLRKEDEFGNKRQAQVPMNDTVFNALIEWRAFAETEHVVEFRGRRISTIRTAFKNAAGRAGFTDVTPHVLRHTAAIHMAASGSPMSKISQYLGHSSTQTTEKWYARYAPDHLLEEAKALDFLASDGGLATVLAPTRDEQ